MDELLGLSARYLKQAETFSQRGELTEAWNTLESLTQGEPGVWEREIFCRVCGCDEFLEIVGWSGKIPLTMIQCNRCHLVQLRETLDRVQKAQGKTFYSIRDGEKAFDGAGKPLFVTVHSLSTQDPVGVLREVYQLLSEKGIVSVFFPYLPNLITNENPIYWIHHQLPIYLTMTDVCIIAKHAGFYPIDCQPNANGLWFLLRCSPAEVLPGDSVLSQLEWEKDLHLDQPESWNAFRERVKDIDLFSKE